MFTRLASCNRAQSLFAACLLSAGVCALEPVQAGPTLETNQSTAIGAQAVYNNSWAQTFEAKGAMSMVAGGDLVPFAQVTSVPLPNSGLASLIATVSNLNSQGGNLDASASIDPVSLLGLTGTSVTATKQNASNNVVLNPSGGNGLPALEITPGTADSSVIGASIIGTNIGTQSLQVTGSLSTAVINTLTAF